MHVNGSLSFRLEDHESAVMELSDNVPELDGIMDDDLYHRFLGGSVQKICRKFHRELFVEAAFRRNEDYIAAHGAEHGITKVQPTGTKESAMLEDELNGIWSDPALASTKKGQPDEEAKEPEQRGKFADEKKQIRPPMEATDNPWETLAEEASRAPFNVFNRD